MPFRERLSLPFRRKRNPVAGSLQTTTAATLSEQQPAGSSSPNQQSGCPPAEPNHGAATITSLSPPAPATTTQSSHDSPSAAPTLWQEAYAALKARNPNLVSKYEQVLTREAHANLNDTKSVPATSMQQAPTSDELDQLIKINIQKAETQSKAVEVVDKVAKVVTAVKDFIASAASNEPHAALAWAGISVTLPVRT